MSIAVFAEVVERRRRGRRRVRESAVRHPFDGWVLDRNGQPTTRQRFGADVAVAPITYADGDWSNGEPRMDLDTAAAQRATVFLPTETVTSPHDEWTIRGQRWRQLGFAADWRGHHGLNPGVVIVVERRVG